MRSAAGESERKCSHCNGSGEIACRNTFPQTYVGPGPVPDDARGVVAETCDACRGWGFVEEEVE